MIAKSFYAQPLKREDLFINIFKVNFCEKLNSAEMAEGGDLNPLDADTSVER